MKRHMLFKRTAFVLVVSLLTQIGLAPAWAQPPAGEVVYYHTDMVGSVRMVTDEGGAAIEQYNYTPFGVVLGGQVPGAAQPRGYAGKERDAETGNDYFGARFYASQIGRFTTVDPVLDLEQALLEPQSWNRYTYSLNNPLKFTDPDGRNPVLVGGIIGAGVFAGWRAYQNYRHGRAWHENIGVEASKGFLIGATLGLAAPAVAGATLAQAGAVAATSAATGTAVLSGRLGTIATSDLDKAFKAGGQTVEVFTRLTHSPAVGRALSASAGEGAHALTAAARPDGALYMARIPQHVIGMLEGQASLLSARRS